MLLYQQFFYFLIGLGVLLGLPALWLFARGMWPAMVERSRAMAARGLLGNFLSGLPVIGLVIFLATNAGKLKQIGGIFAVVLVGLLIMWALIGAAGIAAHVGARLWPDCTGDHGWRAMWRGGLVVSGMLAIPFIGWYILLLILITTGCGMRLRMWFQRSPQAAPTAAPAAAQPAA